MKNRKKMENLRYILYIEVSSLYIAILLLLRTLRYYLSTKNDYQNQPCGKWGFFVGGVVGILMKNR